MHDDQLDAMVATLASYDTADIAALPVTSAELEACEELMHIVDLFSPEVTESASVAPAPQRPRRRKIVPLVALVAALGIVSAATAVAVSQRGAHTGIQGGGPGF